MFSTRCMSGLVRLRPALSFARMMSATPANGYSFETLAVTVPEEHVYHVELNRPKKLNALNKVLWREIGECFNKLEDDSDCRTVVLSGSGRLFTSGLDLSDLTELAGYIMGGDDVARKCRFLRRFISEFQDAFSSLEKCPKPVIAAIHSACVGGGVDLICSTDIRYCTSDAWFQVKEVDIGLAADIGTLQRLPKILGSESLVRELCFSARKMFSSEAHQCGLVSRIFQDKESMLKGAIDMAATIASKSPVAVQNTKQTLIHARDHSVQEGLNFVGNMNMSMLQSEDLRIAAMAQMTKEKATFAKL